MDEKLLTPKQIAEKLHCHPVTARKMITDGKIKAIKINQKYLIRESDFEAYLKSQEQGIISQG